MFEQYSPLEDKMVQVMDNEGNIINPGLMPDLTDDQILKAYKDMLFERTADLMTVSYQRQGRIYTYPPNYGQEAIHIATAFVLDDEDWVVPAFREMGVYLAKGATLKEIFLYFMGYEDGTVFKNAKNILPISVPIASQLPHATGVGYAVKYKGEHKAVFTFVGDGGTSEGDFHEALNFAGVWHVPVIFIVQNNQYAISTRKENQTASINYAVKAVAYGIKGIKVDGNDFFAMYAVAKEAKDRAVKNYDPILIEAVTYRKGAHTTSDDPTKYRDKEEEKQWDERDPLRRLKAYLVKKGLWSEDQEQKLVAEYKKQVDRIFSEAENYGPYKLEDVFKYMYADMPDDLRRQMHEHERFLRWKEELAKQQKQVINN